MTTATDFLTTAPLLGARAPREVTGNEWLSLPDIELASGALTGLTVLHEGAGGLLELAGLPVTGGQLLAPFFFTRPAGGGGETPMPGGRVASGRAI